MLKYLTLYILFFELKILEVFLLNTTYFLESSKIGPCFNHFSTIFLCISQVTRKRKRENNEQDWAESSPNRSTNRETRLCLRQR
jgi:hypothetical protein